MTQQDGQGPASLLPDLRCAPFGVGTDRKGEARAAINVRCLEGVDLSALEVVLFDGRSL